MESIFKEIKKLACTIFIVYIFIAGITIAAGAFSLSVAFGMVYGLVFSILYYILLGNAVQKALDMEAKQAKRYMRINYACRFVLLFVILAIPFNTEKINEWCVFAAFLSPKLTYFIIGFFNTFLKRGGR